MKTTQSRQERTTSKARSSKIRTSRARLDCHPALVPDPTGKTGETIVVVRRGDLLDDELLHKNITPEEYQTGRKIQRILERMSRPTGPTWLGQRVDGGKANHDGTMIVHLDDARYLKKMREDLGILDDRIVRTILGAGIRHFEDAAKTFGWSGERQVTYCASRFRDALGILVDKSLQQAA